MHLSMRPELHALARAWVSAAEDTASRKAVSLKAGGGKEIKGLNKNNYSSLVISNPKRL